MHGREASLAMMASWISGATLAEIAARYGVSKQRVHQRIRKVATPADRQRARRAQDERRRREREAAEAERARLAAEAAAAAGRTCPICDALVVSPGRVTCSSDCARAWEVARRTIDPEKHQRHRITQARAILRDTSRHTEAEVRWAERMLSDDPPPPNRRYFQPGSATARVVQEISR